MAVIGGPLVELAAGRMEPISEAAAGTSEMDSNADSRGSSTSAANADVTIEDAKDVATDVCFLKPKEQGQSGISSSFAYCLHYRLKSLESRVRTFECTEGAIGLARCRRNLYFKNNYISGTRPHVGKPFCIKSCL